MRKAVFVTLLFALSGVLLFYCLSGVSSFPSLRAESGAQASERGDNSEDEDDYEFVNFIPKQEILFNSEGTPDTHLGLEDVFAKHPRFEKYPDIVPEFEIVDFGKKSVAVPRLSGNTLIVEWKGPGTSRIVLRATNPETGKSVDEQISLRAWVPDFVQMCLGVIGGLGVFLLGMKNMSEGLQIVAGSGLRKMIATLTDNRFTAVIVGFVTTMLIQSSSVTSVMVVGFINSQIMTLSQGIGVIMGANIGTTFTGWLLTMNLTKYGLPMVGISAIVFLFVKRERIRYFAMIVMGLGFVFFGLELMQAGMSAMRDLPMFTKIMNMFSADSYIGVLKCIFVGCALTMIVQSSSATLGITISLAVINAIDFDTAAALILGENIGTTITALLASIGTSPSAKRAACFHCCFNVFGVMWISLIFLPVFLPLIKYIVGVDASGKINDPAVGIALTHTLFNVANTILFLPFTRTAAKLLTKYIAPNEHAVEQSARLTGLQARMLESPILSIEHSRFEILKMSQECSELATYIKSIMTAPEVDEKKVAEAFKMEDELDSYQDEVIEFMAELLAGNGSHEVAVSARGQLRMADELESISDYLIVILKSHLKLRTESLAIPEPEFTLMMEAYDDIQRYLALVNGIFIARKNVHEVMSEIYSQGRYITHRVKTIRDNFLRKMSEEKFDPQVVVAINTQLNAFRRVREHTQNIAEAIDGR